jgi:hypothetical protein
MNHVPYQKTTPRGDRLGGGVSSAEYATALPSTPARIHGLRRPQRDIV